MVWFIVLFLMLILWVFYIMEVVGDFSEDLFENFVNDVFMMVFCCNIEIDLR